MRPVPVGMGGRSPQYGPYRQVAAVQDLARPARCGAPVAHWVHRLTGSRQPVTEDAARQWLATRQDHHDRADWAIVRRQDDVVLGEVVLNELAEQDASVNFRILLVKPGLFGRGYGTEATRLVVDYALDVAGLHRISLEVYDFNPRAQRVYEKCGFVREGVCRDALYWDGEWHDAIRMSILSTDPRAGLPGE
jgi:RimJ/RimL family protein N-acetyltransferase